MKKALSVLLALALFVSLFSIAYADISVVSPQTSVAINSIELIQNSSVTIRVTGSNVGDTFSYPVVTGSGITAGDFVLTPLGFDGVTTVGSPSPTANFSTDFFHVTKANGYMDFLVSAGTTTGSSKFGNYLISYQTGKMTNQYALNQAALNVRLNTMNAYFDPAHSQYAGATPYSLAPVELNKAKLTVKQGLTTNNLAEQAYSAVPAITPFTYTAPAILSESDYNQLATSPSYEVKRLVNGTEDKTNPIADDTCVYTGTLTLDKGIYDVKQVNTPSETKNIILYYKAAVEPERLSAHMYIAMQRAMDLKDSTIRIDARTNQISSVTGNANTNVEAKYNNKDTYSESTKTWMVTGNGTYTLTKTDFNYFMSNNPSGKDLQIIVDNGVFDIANKDMPYVISKNYTFKVTPGADSAFMWTRVAKVSGDNNRPWVFSVDGADFAPSKLSITITSEWIAAYGHKDLNLYQFNPSVHEHDNCEILSHYDDKATAVMSGLKLEDTRETVLKVNIKDKGIYFLSNKKLGALNESNKDANPNTGGGDIY